MYIGREQERMQDDNTSGWDGKSNGFYEVWYLKLNLPAEGATPGPALWLRFTTLRLKTGLKKVAETWAIFFEPTAGGGSKKIAIKNTVPLSALRLGPGAELRIEHNELLNESTRGSVSGRGNQLSWDLSFTTDSYTFHHVPETIRALPRLRRILGSSVCKPNIDARFSGWFEVNGKRYEVKDVPGCQGHIWGKRQAAEWAWAHCNRFEEAVEGHSSVLEVLSARTRMGGLLKSPLLSALYFSFKGERYEFNRLSDAVAIRSEYSLTSWRFAAERGSIRLQGQVECDLKDLAGVTYEDTNGGYLYCNNTELASVSLSVYFRGKLETTLRSRQTAAFETVTRERSKYVEILV